MMTINQIIATKEEIEKRVAALTKVSAESRKQLTKDDKAVLKEILVEEQTKLEDYLSKSLTETGA